MRALIFVAVFLAAAAVEKTCPAQPALPLAALEAQREYEQAITEAKELYRQKLQKLAVSHPSAAPAIRAEIARLGSTAQSEAELRRRLLGNVWLRSSALENFTYEFRFQADGTCLGINARDPSKRSAWQRYEFRGGVLTIDGMPSEAEFVSEDVIQTLPAYTFTRGFPK